MNGVDRAMQALDAASYNGRLRGPRRVAVVLPEHESMALQALAARFGMSLSEVASTLLCGALADVSTELDPVDVSYDAVKDATARLAVKRPARHRYDDGDYAPTCHPSRSTLADGIPYEVAVSRGTR